jgi:hypothetical protein
MTRFGAIMGAIAIIAAGASLACASAKPRERAREARADEKASAGDAKDVAPAAEGGVVLGKLQNANLPAGACGMLIWMMDGDAPSPVFRYVSGAAGQISVSGKTLELARIETEGASNFGVHERQKFTSGAGMTVDLKVEFGTPFEGGLWLQNGLVAIESGDGWRTVAPVAGVAGCRAK